MTIDNLIYIYCRKHGSSKVYLILHGGGAEGIETTFISQVMNSLRQKNGSVFGFNFPYCERGEKESSGPQLTEEIDALDAAITFLRNEGYQEIIIVAKSLGGIVASYYLDQHRENSEIKLAILGYVVGSVKTSAIKDTLTLVIQGENDRFGSAEVVRNELAQHNVSAKIIEIPRADHSYRDANKKPIYQKDAVARLLLEL